MSLPRTFEQANPTHSMDTKTLIKKIKEEAFEIIEEKSVMNKDGDSIKIDKSGLFGQTLWIMAVKLELIRHAVVEACPTFGLGLINIILNYQFLDSEVTLKISQSPVLIKESFLRENSHCADDMDLKLKFSFNDNKSSERFKGKQQPSEPVNVMTKLLNTFSISPVKVSQDVDENTKEVDKRNEDPGDSKNDVLANSYSYVITGPKSLWIHPEFLKEIKNVKNNYSQEEWEYFLEKSGKIIQKTSEVIAELDKHYSQLENDNEYKTNDSTPALLAALKEYIAFVKNSPLNPSSLNELEPLGTKVRISLVPFIETSFGQTTPELIIDILVNIDYIQEVVTNKPECDLIGYFLRKSHGGVSAYFFADEMNHPLRRLR